MVINNPTGNSPTAVALEAVIEGNYDLVLSLLSHNKCAIRMSNSHNTFYERSFLWHKIELKKRPM